MADSRNHRRIIIAMDGSDHADYAFEYYLEHIHRPTDEVILVYCADISIVVHSPLRGGAANIEKIISEQERSMDDITEELNRKIQKAKIRGRITRLMNKDIGHSIVDQAEKEKAALIITGTRGRSKLRRTFLGSVSEYIVNHASIPVLTCRFIPEA